jgi:hypothetical protein
VTPGPTSFHVQLYKGSPDHRFIGLLAFLVLAVSAFGQSPQVVLGSSQIQSSRDNNASGMAEAFPVTAPKTGQVSSLYVFLDSSNTAATAWVGLYTSGYGHPRTLMTQSMISKPLPGRWNAVAVPPVQVTQGRRYWIALLGLNGQIQFRDSVSNCQSETSQRTDLASLPGTWSTGSQWNTCVVSMFGAGALSPPTAPPPTIVSLALSPTTASLQPGQQAQFTATVSGTSNSLVNWTASGGTISSTGMYKAPSVAGTYTVTAISAADSTKSSSATVTVAAPTQVSISISPTTSSLQGGGQQLFVAMISGTSNSLVNWTASGGTISSTGLYKAPSAAGTYTVTVTSAADPSKSSSATVTVAAPTQVSISISPTTSSLQTGGQQLFVAMISGTSNTAVTWSASVGTIASNGTYTAPSTAGNYTVTAVSVADPTKAASAVVSVSVPAIAVRISPATVSMPEKWQQQFAATVSGSSNTAVTWSVTQGTGTIAQSGLYTAPQAVETDVVTATSQVDGTKSAGAIVTIVPPHSVSLTWMPSSPSGVSYNVYRGTVSGGPYNLLQSGVSTTSYVDSNVQSGSTYYYVTAAVDASGLQSAYSVEAQAVIPMP